MAATVEIMTPVEGSRVAVPDSALIDTGRRKVVLVERGEGRYEPRKVEVGGTAACRAGCRSRWLEAGERVVTQAYLPDRRREQTSGRRCAALVRETHVIGPVIRWSARNLLLGPDRGAQQRSAAACSPVGRLSLRRHSRSLRHSGHRLHPRCRARRRRSSRTQVTYPLYDGAACRTAQPRGARLLVLRRLVRLRDLRGRHRHLLGAQPGARISQLGHRQAAGPACSPRSGRTRPAWAGSINMSCSAPTAPWPSCARCRTGTCASGSPRRRVWPRWRASAASCASTTSSSIR